MGIPSPMVRVEPERAKRLVVEGEGELVYARAASQEALNELRKLVLDKVALKVWNGGWESEAVGRREVEAGRGEDSSPYGHGLGESVGHAFCGGGGGVGEGGTGGVGGGESEWEVEAGGRKIILVWVAVGALEVGGAAGGRGQKPGTTAKVGEGGERREKEGADRLDVVSVEEAAHEGVTSRGLLASVGFAGGPSGGVSAGGHQEERASRRVASWRASVSTELRARRT